MSDKQQWNQWRPEDLKAGGLIPQRQKGTVTVRCMAPGGRLTAERLHKIAEVAEKYGQGIVHLSVRMSPEILYVPLKDVGQVIEELQAVGQPIASCGKRVRVPTACGGCEYNPNGLVDTQAMAQGFNDRYFGRDQFHKFKTAFAGCPIDCTRSRESDLGYQGQVEPKLDPELCNGCGLCVQICTEQALELQGNLPVRNLERCNACGDCMKSCPFDAFKPDREGVAVFVGGKHGKHPHAALPVAQFVPVELVYAVAEKVMDWYANQGLRGERLGNTIDRVGIDGLRRELVAVVGPERMVTREELAQHRWRSLYWAGAGEAFPAYGDL